jgi:hypothetical protein
MWCSAPASPPRQGGPTAGRTARSVRCLACFSAPPPVARGLVAVRSGDDTSGAELQPQIPVMKRAHIHIPYDRLSPMGEMLFFFPIVQDCPQASRRPARKANRRIYSGAGGFLVRGGKCSCELLLLGDGHESTRGKPTHAWWKLLRRASPRNFSCEAETPQKGSLEELVRGSSHARRRVLVRGGRKSCERAYYEKLFGDKKTSRMNGIPTLEHRLSD